MSKEIHLEIAGTSVGGCNYIIRILKKIHIYGHCNVMITNGSMQDSVYRKVTEHIAIVNEVANTNLFVDVYKEEF
jgi:hypothetical protein